MPLMRRRPLLRAAALGGGAYCVGKRRQEAEQREYEEQQRLAALEARARPRPTGLSPHAINRLKRLGRLHKDGVLTDDEFAQQKARLLKG